MIKQKIYLVVFLIVVVSFKSYSQTKQFNKIPWVALKKAAHDIGFCVHHINYKACNKHSKIKSKLEKISNSESDVYYFQLNSKWAKKRLTDLAKNKKSRPVDYFIFFDVDQNSTKKLHDSTKTSNTYKMFSVLNLNDKFEFKTRRASNSYVSFYISSSRENSILSNTMWREFMSNRLGKLNSEIEISLSGNETLTNYHKFKAAFLKFQLNHNQSK